MTDQSPRPRGSALSRFTRGEKFVGVGSLLVLVSFVLPWMDVSGGGASVGAFHGAGLLTVLAWLGVVVLFVTRSPLFRNTVDLPKMPASEAVLFAVGGGVQILGLIIFYAQYHSVFGISRSIKFGYLLALAGGILTTVAAVTALRSGATSLYADAQVEPQAPLPPAAPDAGGVAPAVPPPPIEDAPPAPPPPTE
jgi:hypothetical protein